MNRTLRANLALLITAMIWGSAFVAQRLGMDAMGPIYFVGIRMLLGSVVLMLIILIASRTSSVSAPAQSSAGDQGPVGARKFPSKTFLAGGLVCGCVLCAGSNFQQAGLVSVDAGKCGFLTALYIILVPLLGLLLRKPIHSNHLIAAILGTIGLYFLCINGGLTIESGDLLALIGAFFWAVHILVVDHFAPKLDPLKLSAAQFFICGVVSLILAPLMGETLTLQMVVDAKFALAYTGIMSTAIGFTLQVVAQRDANPTAASLIMSMEALFAVIFGFLFLGERFTSREALGALFMMAAVIIAQISIREIREFLKHRQGSTSQKNDT